MAGEPDRRQQLVAIGVILVALAVYWTSHLGRLRSIDEIAMFAVTENLVKHRTLAANQVAFTYHVGADNLASPGPSRDFYSHKGLLSSLLAVPFYWTALHAPGVGLLHASLISSPVFTALAAGLLYLAVVRLGFSDRAALATALSFAFGSMAWPYAGTLYTEPTAAFVWSGALYLLILSTGPERGPWFAALAGALLGVSLAASLAYVVVVPALLIYLVLQAFLRRGRAWTQVVGFLAGWLALSALVLWANTIRFGGWFQTGYGLETIAFRLDGAAVRAYGLLLSPYRGLFWYVPLALALPLSYAWFIRRWPLEGLLCLAVVVAVIGLYSTWTIWWGGVNWGPRYLVPLMPFLSLGWAPVWERGLSTERKWWSGWRLALFLLAGLSALVQLVGAATDYLPYDYAYWLDYFRALSNTEPVASVPILVDPRLSPIWLQAQDFLRGRLDLAWFHAGGHDWPALAVGFLIILITGAFLWRSTRKGTTVSPYFAGLTTVGVLAGFGWMLPRADADRATARFELLIEIVRAHAGPDDAVLVMLPYDYGSFADVYRMDLPVYGLPWKERVLRPEMATLLERLAGRHPKLWVLASGSPAADPDDGVEYWLVQNAFKAVHAYEGNIRLSAFGTAPTEATLSGCGDYLLGGIIRLEVCRQLRDEYRVGEVVPVELTWESLAPTGRDFKVFIHLDDEAGGLLAQRDAQPMDGYRPTPLWQAGERIRDRHGLLLPRDAAPGIYRLYVGMYDSLTGERLAVAPPQPDHRIPLGTIEIVR